jgi:RHS repeat-associated protein
MTGTLAYAFGFTGREHDVDTGLIYSRARYYDSTVAQWLSPDRKGDINGPNFYAYVMDRPTILTDPTGNDVWIEGRTEGENPIHLSVCIGTPLTSNGNTFCYSFQFNPSNPLKGLATTVAGSSGGQIVAYLQTDSVEDMEARQVIEQAGMVYNQSIYLPPSNTCVQFSWAEFNAISSQLGVPQSAPPAQADFGPQVAVGVGLINDTAYLALSVFVSVLQEIF